jgi:hypothetical protein
MRKKVKLRIHDRQRMERVKTKLSYIVKIAVGLSLVPAIQSQTVAQIAMKSKMKNV